MTSIFEGHPPPKQDRTSNQNSQGAQNFRNPGPTDPPGNGYILYPTFFFGKENHPLPKPPWGGDMLVSRKVIFFYDPSDLKSQKDH